MKILIAEDEADLREHLTLLLTRFGHEVQAAADGTEAVQIATSFAPDLFVTDWRMPGMDGITAAEQMKCKTILMSASPKVELIGNGHIVGFLKKPIRAHELLWLVKNAATTNSMIESAR